MDILITKKKSELTTPESINFTELVRNSNTTLSLTCQSDMIDLLNTEFTEKQSKWYIANLYLYLNYDSTTDYPINLENIFHMIGFANKGNAKRTLENNFTKEEDYKITILPSEKGQIAREDIMLNIDCFKSLCMLAKTDKGKEIRKYYVKLESINNKIIKKQIEENTKKLLEQQQIIIEEKDKEKTILLEKEKENTTKLLEEKDKYIAQLKQQEVVPILYIGYNPLIKNKHKIGISSETSTNDILVRKENHKSSNPDFEFLFTYETPNAKLIEYLVKLLLKPFRLQKPEWFSISYERIKQVVDFCIMMYDNYKIEDSVDNLIEFISRYRSNRLINTNKARIMIDTNLYEEWFAENSVIIPNAKISTELICNDFYEWYKIKFPDKLNLTHIKLETGNWSTFFQKEIAKNISNITKLEYTQGISFTDRKRGIHFPKCAGFIGFELKSMNKKLEYFDKTIYEKYVKEFITITNNPKNKLARVELLDDFLIWVKNNNYPTKNKILCRSAISTIFKDNLIDNIENITGLKIQNDICKLTYSGCFIGVIHSKFPFNGNESSPREIVNDEILIKRQIDNWLKDLSKISTVFKKIIDCNQLSIEEVKNIMKPSYTDLTLNKKKRKWYLIFRKDEKNYYLTEKALEYYNSIKIN